MPYSSSSESSDSETEYYVRPAPPRLNPNHMLSTVSAQQRRPTPPETPTSSSFIAEPRSVPLSSNGRDNDLNRERSTRRHGLQMHNFYAPLQSHFVSREQDGEIMAVGEGHLFNYRPHVRQEDLSPRSSASSGPYRPKSLSGRSEQGSDEEEEEEDEDDEDDDEDDEDDEEDSDDESVYDRIPTFSSPAQQRSSPVVVADFTIVEMSVHTSSSSSSETNSDSDLDSDSSSEAALSIVHPTRYSSASSRRSSGASTHRSIRSSHSIRSTHSSTHSLAQDFQNLDCNASFHERELWIAQQRALKRKKRLSSGSIHKRTLSMSIGSDTDDEDVTGPYEIELTAMGASASGLRRLRRKTNEMHEEGMAGNGVGRFRGSLIFEDPPQRIVECEEPTDSEDGDRWSPPARVPDIEGETLMGALPYYLMDIDERAY